MSHLQYEPSVGSSHVVLSILHQSSLLSGSLPACFYCYRCFGVDQGLFIWKENSRLLVAFLQVHFGAAFLFDTDAISGGQAGLVAFRSVYLTMHAIMYKTMHCVRIEVLSSCQTNHSTL
jgi:hypothetical protein